MEVSTPLLCQAGVTDPAIEPFVCDDGTEQRYLQSSPEYAMKRLLAAGVGAIYQIAPTFRAGEAGSRHNPEFTLLEWYRPDFDDQALMSEVGDLVGQCLQRKDVSRISYRQAFLDALGIDPHRAFIEQLVDCAHDYIDLSFDTADRDVWLDLLMSHVVEPTLARRGLCFVYDYPASQAALARIAEVDGCRVAKRFELYVDGLELANGYFELTDAAEQAARFDADNKLRATRGQPPRPIDQRLLAALEHGMPDCAGVALGFDRLLMCQLGIKDIRQVLAFDWVNC